MMDTAMKVIPREPPELGPAREALVKQWTERVMNAKAFWRRSFDRMRADMRFAAGLQWPDQSPEDDRYVANVVLRHIQQRTAVVYGKNPKVVARRRERLLGTIWDGRGQSLQQAVMALQVNPLDMNAMAILMDAQQVQSTVQMLDKVGKTLELVYDYNIDEQVVPFKEGMKGVVRKALTTGVGYVKLGFQRAMARTPEVERQIADINERLATIERLSADLADGETEPDSAEAEQLRLAMQALEQEPEHIVREGLAFDYPDSTAIIPDPRCRQLKNFVGCQWVAEEFMLSSDDIKEVYGIDVCSGESPANAYRVLNEFQEAVPEFLASSDKIKAGSKSLYCVWEIYSRRDGLVYVLCEGYKDFLTEPMPPDAFTERFWPWFVFTTNEVYNPDSIMPVSDVRLIRDMQLELNRARQGLREHRRANRPKMAVASGMLDDEDKDKLVNHPANAILELNALQPGQKIQDVLQPVAMPAIDPALYEVNPTFEDILRVVGVQEANLGGTTGATATESSIAESSRMSAVSSTTDDLDQMLTEMARAAGQILLANVTQETAMEIVGPGAVWPVLTKDQIAREIYLEIEAASTGRPNKAAEVQNATQIVPLLMQIPGINPEWLAREMIRRMDDRLDITEAFAAGLPSIQAMNRPTPALPGPGGDGPPSAEGPDKNPSAQGGEGANNAPSTQPDQNNSGPRPRMAGQANPMTPAFFQ